MMVHVKCSLRQFGDMLIKDNLKVILFGLGETAKKALSIPAVRNAAVMFADNGPMQGSEAELCGLTRPVISPGKIAEMAEDNFVILIASGHFAAIKKQLAGLNLPEGIRVAAYPELAVCFDDDGGFFENRILNDCVGEYAAMLRHRGVNQNEADRLAEEMRRLWQGEDGRPKQFVLPRVMIMPGTRCNLRCVGCSSLFPLFDKPQDLPIERIIGDLEVFFGGIDACVRLTVGGEPFLYPRIKELLTYLLTQEKVLGILLFTNSMVLPDAELLDMLKDRKVFVEVSDYGYLVQMSRMITTLEKNNVNFEVLTDQYWTDMGGVECRSRTPDELRFIYLNCEQPRLIKAIFDGRFYTCARAARMDALGAYKSEKDSFPLSDRLEPLVIRQKIEDMYNASSADACNYCDLGALPAKKIKAGIQHGGGVMKSAYTIIRRGEYEH